MGWIGDKERDEIIVERGIIKVGIGTKYGEMEGWEGLFRIIIVIIIIVGRDRRID